MGLFQGAYRLLTNTVAVDVAVVDGNGDQLTGFDQSRPANAALTTVASSTTSVTLLAANPARREVYIQNVGSKILYVAFDATASLAAFTLRIAANSGERLTLNSYTGVISGIWNAVNGNAVITEITA